MLGEIFDIIHDLNEGRIIEAANKILQLIRDKDDENLIKIGSEIEKEIKALREDEEIYHIVTVKTLDELKNVILELKRARIRKIEVLIRDLIRRISNNNVLVEEALKPKSNIRPNTYM